MALTQKQKATAFEALQMMYGGDLYGQVQAVLRELLAAKSANGAPPSEGNPEPDATKGGAAE